MKLDRARITERSVLVTLGGWLRIFPAIHAATPTGAGFGSSRHSSPSRSFRTLYAGDSFAVAFAEAVVRDRFVGLERRYLYRPALEQLVVAEISTSSELALLDFTGAAAYELGIDTDAKGARAHDAGQALAEALHAQTGLDGILYDSRLTGHRCVAIFDRAHGKLSAPTPVDLVGLAEFENEIERLKISVRRKRGL